MIRKTSRTKRIKEAKDLLSEVGMNFREDRDWNTFQVWPDGDKRGGLSTYDTLGTSDSDLEDALGTGLDMAKRLKKANPRKCKTFQVKRKVGKKTIQVRRKICRNPNSEIINQLLDLINKRVTIHGGNAFDNSSRGWMIGKLELNSDYKDEYRLYDSKEQAAILFNSKNVDRIKDNFIFLKD